MEDKQHSEENAAREQEERTVVVEENIEDLPARRRKKTVYKGMWGTLEMAAVGISLLFLLAVIAGYLLFVLPESRELEANRARRDQLDTELAAANKKFGDMTTTEGQVAKLVASAEDFEVRFLQEESIGRTAIYQRLNGLINAFGLVNSTGPDYTPIEMSEGEQRGAGGNERAQSGRAKYQSLFPGIYVTMTVEGSYVNLRRFLSEIENSNEYIVISSIELEPSETEESTTTGDAQATTASANPAAQASGSDTLGRTRGKVVSLRLELAAYFQRENEKKVLTALTVAESAAAN